MKVLGMLFLLMSAPLWAAGEGTSPFTPRTTKEGYPLVCRDGVTSEVLDGDVRDNETRDTMCPKREVCLDPNPNVVNFYDVTVVRPFNKFEGPNYVTGGTGSTCLFEVCMTEGDPNRPENLQNYPAERTSHNPALCANHPDPEPEPEPEPEPVDPGPTPTPEPTPEPKLVSEPTPEPECAFIEPDRLTGLPGTKVPFTVYCTARGNEVPCGDIALTSSDPKKVKCDGVKCTIENSVESSVVATLSSKTKTVTILEENSRVVLNATNVPDIHAQTWVPYASKKQGVVGETMGFFLNVPAPVWDLGQKVILYDILCVDCKGERRIKTGEVQFGLLQNKQGAGIKLTDLEIKKSTKPGRYEIRVSLVDFTTRQTVYRFGSSVFWVKVNREIPPQISLEDGRINLRLNPEQTALTVAKGGGWEVALTYGGGEGNFYYLPLERLIQENNKDGATVLTVSKPLQWLAEGDYNTILIFKGGDGKIVTFWYASSHSPGVMLQ